LETGEIRQDDGRTGGRYRPKAHIARAVGITRGLKITQNIGLSEWRARTAGYLRELEGESDCTLPPTGVGKEVPAGNVWV